MKRILFVDDDPVVCGLYCTRLEREGYSVDMAANGLAAIESLNRSKPDLVVLDLMLPEVNGVEILKWIRRQPRLRGLPVVVLSNAYLTDMVASAMMAGANTALFKCQCTPAKLLRVIKGFWGEPNENGGGNTPGNGGVAEPNGLPPAADQAVDPVDEQILRGARAEFVSDAAAEVAKLRALVVSHAKSASPPEALAQLRSLYQRVHSLNARAGMTGCLRVGMLANAFEAMLFEMVAKPNTLTPTLQQTIAQATDCLGRLVAEVDQDPAAAVLEARALVVDDDAVSGLLNVTILRRMGVAVTSTKDSQEALRMLESSPYDIVLLDINMPGLDGFEVCKQLRRLPHHQTTPVIFVTAHGDFGNRVQSVLSGGNEFITKPVLPLELALKTVTLLLDTRLRAPATLTTRTTAAAVATDDQPPAVPQASTEGGNGHENVEWLAAASAYHANGADVASHLIPDPDAPSRIGNRATSPTQPQATQPGSEKSPASAAAPTPQQPTQLPGAAGASPPPPRKQRPPIAETSPQNTETLANRLGAQSEALAAVQAQIEAQRRQLAEAQAARAALEELNKELERQVSNLRAEMATLRDQCGWDETQSRLQTQAEALAAAQAEADAQHRQADEARAAEAALRQSLQDREQQLEALRAELAQIRIQVQEREQDLSSARATLAELQERYAAATQEAHTASQGLAEARAQLAEAIQHRQAAEQTAEAEAEARKRLEAELDRQQQAETQWRESLQAAEAKLEVRACEVATALAQVENHQRQADEARAAEAALRQNLQDLEQQVEALRAELEASRARAEAQEQTIAATQARLAAQDEHLAKARAAMTALQERYATAAQEVQAANSALAQAQARLAQELARRRATERELAAGAEARRSLQAIADASQQAADELRRSLEAAEARLDAQSRELGQAQAEALARRQELTDARAAEAELKQVNEQLKQQLDALQAQVTEAQSRLESQARALAEARAQLDAQARSLADARAQHEARGAQLQAASEELRAARQQLAQEQAERERLSTALAQAQQTREDLARDLDALRQQEQAARQALQRLESDTRQRLEQAQAQTHKAEQAHRTTRRQLDLMRYAALEAGRLHARWADDNLQRMRGHITGLQQAVQAVLDTPLSTSQRRLLAALQRELTGWPGMPAEDRAVATLLPEMPELQDEVFSLAELMREVEEALQTLAAGRRAEAETTVSDDMPANVRGDAAHLRHLLVQLAAALLHLADARKLLTRIATHTTADGRAELTVQYNLDTPGEAAELVARLLPLIEPATGLPTGADGEAPLALAASAALARVLDGTILLETGSQQGLRVTVALPLTLDATRPVASQPDALPGVTEPEESCTASTEEAAPTQSDWAEKPEALELTPA